MTELEILDPTAGAQAPAWPLRPRRSGPVHVGLLDISKPQGDVFLDELERLLVTAGHSASRYRKPTMTRPATGELIAEMAAACDAALVALAD
jgi:hypothetical protein